MLISTEIEQYINFARQNWYDNIPWKIKIKKCRTQSWAENNIRYLWLYIHYIWLINWTKIRRSLSDILFEKEFIEAVAKGLLKDREKLWNYLWKEIKIPNLNEFVYLDSIIADLTCRQAVAIRDNKLNNFIINLLKND